MATQRSGTVEGAPDARRISMIAAKQGLGQQIMEYSYAFQPAGVFGILFYLALIAVALNGLMSAIERRLMRWKRDE